MSRCSQIAVRSLLALTATACMPADPARIPERLKIGVLPGEDGTMLKARFTPLLDYLAQQLGIATELVIPEDYEALVQAFGNGQIDLALFGGVTFLAAETAHGAVSLVLREIDLHFQSTYLIRTDLQAGRLEDCAGLRLAFGSRQSTSGHLMPRYFMAERGIDVDSFFSELIYSGSHDRTIELVANDKADLGVVDKQVIDALFRSGAIDGSQVRVLEESPQFPDYVWAVPPDLDLDLRRQLRSAFLELLPDGGKKSEILSRLQTRYFLPATQEDFRVLRMAAADLATKLILR